ncbi:MULTISPECIES: hypothetical protein [unclassified Legionella]|uniref:hypothetical protein n=1 Tax=unclassified Legionella TaxID=2622702 RepID=UPI0013EF7663|nr:MULTISPECIES: hypothetical protein [unclassified Legionella]MDI9819730.1 hypothetical protein [Legionella sp. PL877]
MPGFTFPKLEVLEANLTALTKKLLDAHGVGEVSKLPTHRQKHLAKIETALHTAEDLQPALFNNQEELETYQAAIVLDTYLAIKKEIETDEYYTEGYRAKVLKKIPIASRWTDPSRSVLYNNLKEAMGVSEKNPLDEEALKIIQEVHSTLVLNQNPLPKIKNLYANGILPEIAQNVVNKLQHVEADSIKPVQAPFDQVTDQIKSFSRDTLRNTATKQDTWTKDDLDQTKDAIRAFNQAKLKKVETKESCFNPEGIFTYQREIHPQPTKDEPALVSKSFK